VNNKKIGSSLFQKTLTLTVKKNYIAIENIVLQLINNNQNLFLIHQDTVKTKYYTHFIIW